MNETPSTTDSQPTSLVQSPATAHHRSLNKSQTVGICAAGLLVCFFLPWTQFFGQSISGFDLQKMGGNQKWLWLIPVFSMITIFAAITGRHQKIAAPLTGALPFCVLAYWLNQFGSNLLQTLSLGAWLSLVCGLTLIIVPHRLK